MRRVSVVGNSGSGKSTFATRLARLMDVPHLELDAVFHQPGWEPLPREQFRATVTDFAAAPQWVIDGNYSAVRDLIWQRADTVIWLDLPRSRVMCRVIWRTVSRAVTRAELWNGNREPLGNFLHADPRRSIIAWAWTRHHKYRERFAAAMADPGNSHLPFVRLTTPRRVAAFLSPRASPSAPTASPSAPSASPSADIPPLTADIPPLTAGAPPLTADVPPLTADVPSVSADSTRRSSPSRPG
ncbi:MAG TPA: hypothetical protein VG253_12760 [Streptosporangiaceae bacterium]|nr:hypothetical protein [Streptosporangiaceae bacterium]